MKVPMRVPIVGQQREVREKPWAWVARQDGSAVLSFKMPDGSTPGLQMDPATLHAFVQEATAALMHASRFAGIREGQDKALVGMPGNGKRPQGAGR